MLLLGHHVHVVPVHALDANLPDAGQVVLQRSMKDCVAVKEVERSYYDEGTLFLQCTHIIVTYFNLLNSDPEENLLARPASLGSPRACGSAVPFWFWCLGESGGLDL